MMLTRPAREVGRARAGVRDLAARRRDELSSRPMRRAEFRERETRSLKCHSQRPPTRTRRVHLTDSCAGSSSEPLLVRPRPGYRDFFARRQHLAHRHPAASTRHHRAENKETVGGGVARSSRSAERRLRDMCTTRRSVHELDIDIEGRIHLRHTDGALSMLGLPPRRS